MDAQTFADRQAHRGLALPLTHVSFFAGELPLLVGFKEGSKRVAEVNIVFGAAEVVGGLVVGRLSDVLPRKLIMVCAMLVYSGGIVIAWFIRLQRAAPFRATPRPWRRSASRSSGRRATTAAAMSAPRPPSASLTCSSWVSASCFYSRCERRRVTRSH